MPKRARRTGSSRDFVSRVPWTLLTRADSDDTPFLALDDIEPVAITIDAAPERNKAAVVAIAQDAALSARPAGDTAVLP